MRHDHCLRKEGIAIFGVGSTSTSTANLGAMAAFTSDGFNTFSLRDLSRSKANVRAAEGSLCANLTTVACSSLEIVDAIMVDSYLIILTNLGLFSSSTFEVATNTTSPMIFRTLSTGQSAIDSASVYLQVASLYGQSDCFKGSQDYVYLTYSPTAAFLASNLLYATSTNLLSNSWSSPLVTSSITGLDATYGFVGACRDIVYGRHVYLVGVPTASQAACPSLEPGYCTFDRARIVLDTGVKQTIGCIFPTSMVVTGFAFHSNNNDLFIYGSEVKSFI